MEDLFAPTTRLRDLYRARERDEDENEDEYADRRMNALVELEMITGSSAEDTFLHSGFS
jgi:predicted ArsR family transcriptional regulator